MKWQQEDEVGWMGMEEGSYQDRMARWHVSRPGMKEQATQLAKEQSVLWEPDELNVTEKASVTRKEWVRS